MNLEQAKQQAIKAGDFETAYEIDQQLAAQKQQPVDFKLGTALKNFPGSAWKAGKGVVDAVAHPVQTAKAVGSLVGSTADVLGRKAAELTTGQKIAPDPELGNEDVAQAAGQGLKNRFGSWDAIKRTAMEDPAGLMMDVSGLGLATRVPGVLRAAGAVEPLSAIMTGLAKTAQVAIPKGLPVRWYETAAKWSTSPNVLSAEDRLLITKTALRHGIMPDASGVRKIENRLDILNNALDGFIRENKLSGREVPLDEVFAHMQELRRSKGGVRLGGQDDVAEIDRITSVFMNDMHKLGKTTVNMEDLQHLKKEAYKSVAWNARRQVNAPIEEEVYKTIARGAKEAIAREVPEAAAFNKELSELYQLQPHLARAAGRLENANLTSINTPLNITAGNVVGTALGAPGIGTAIGTTAAVLGNPKIKAMTAIVLDKIRRGDVKWLRENVHPQEVIVALSEANRERLAQQKAAKRERDER